MDHVKTTVIQPAMVPAKIIVGMSTEILAIERAKDQESVANESAVVVQDVPELVAVHVNLVVEEVIDFKNNFYGKGHFISARVFQELSKESFAPSCGGCYANTTNFDFCSNCDEL